MNWIYPITIILYSLSVLGYFIDFLQHNRKVNRMAFWLLSIVWILQTTFFIIRTLELERVPVLTPFEGLFFYAWLVVTLSLAINWYFHVDFLVFFTNVIGFSMMAFSLFTPSGDVPDSLSMLLVSELLVIHISMILLSYSAFTLSFACQVMYVLQHQMLKRKVWGKRMLRLGSLSKLDSFSFVAVLIAWPLFLIGLILGFVWAANQYTTVPLFDAKVISSLVVLGVYAVYLYERVVKLTRGYNMSLLGIAGFLILLINYFLSGEYSKFHIWY
ncbi:cytochrome c biogenesis protein CcsA [bacterium LRH843]|nr:cytochrome c biogenesis protein CcsA [bacterium LRH843]